MSRRTGAIFLVGLAAVSFGVAAYWIETPGYLDAEYYRSVALRVATGHGLSVPFLWNYLSGIEQIPAPAHMYWMPLTSLVGALTTTIAPGSFRSTQLAFLLLAVSLPLLTYYVAHRIGLKNRLLVIAGMLACFPGFYLPFWLTSDTFALFAITAVAVFLWGQDAGADGGRAKAVMAGAAVGFGHLTRADGFLLWIPLLVLLLAEERGRTRRLGLAAAGYCMALLPWLVRNQLVFESFLPPGISRALWLTSYDQLFSYPSDVLTMDSFLSSGLGAILSARLEAGWMNLKSLLLVNGLVFLALPMLLGGWRLRSNALVRASAAYLLVLYLAMSAVFPFAGSRGGFFHSSSALMPLLYPLAAVGIDVAGDWYARYRKLESAFARRFFLGGAVLISLIATAFLFNTRVIQQGWGTQQRTYVELDRSWTDLGKSDRVAVNNPAAFWLATGVQAIVIPDGPPQSLTAAMSDFNARWAVLESDHPDGLSELYDQPADRPGLRYRASFEVAPGVLMHIYSAEEGAARE